MSKRYSLVTLSVVAVIGIIVGLAGGQLRQMLGPVPAERNEIEGLCGFTVSGAVFLNGHKRYFIGSRPPSTVPRYVVGKFELPIAELGLFAAQVELKSVRDAAEAASIKTRLLSPSSSRTPEWLSPDPTPGVDEWFEDASSYLLRGPDTYHRRTVGLVDRRGATAYVYLLCDVDS